MHRLTTAVLVLAAALATPLAPASAEPPVLTPEDAVRPVEGTDYTLITRLQGDLARRATEVTGSGEVLLVSAPVNEKPTYVLLDPRTMKRTKIPSPGHDPQIIEANADVVRYDSRRPIETPHIYTYDRASRRTSLYVVPEVPDHPKNWYRVMGIEDGRVWFSTGRRHAWTRWVWSAEIGDPGPPRLEAETKKTVPSLHDGVLTWLHRHWKVVVMQDVATGRTTRWHVPPGCASGPWVWGDGEDFAMVGDCGTDENGSEIEPTWVVSIDGQLEATLYVDQGILSMSDRGIFFWGYVYDQHAGKLFDIWRDDDPYGTGNNYPPASGPGAHPVMLWPVHTDEQDHGLYRTVDVVRLK